MGYLDPVLGPLLTLPPLLSIAIVSVVISVIITFAYKWLTDQDEMKSLKDDMKKLQQKMKDHKKDPAKLMKVQKEAMDKNMAYMMKSMKPTLITFLPIIIIFGWLNTHMAFYPLVQDVPFSVTLQFNDGISGNSTIVLPEGIELVDDIYVKDISDGKVIWALKGKASEVPYTISFKNGDELYNKDLLITPSKNDRKYLAPMETIKKSDLKTITVSNEKIQPLNLFGWKIGWLGTYIIFSLIVSLGIRKLLKIY